MNFLAHIYLSGNDEQVTIGNFIGDFVKGKNFEHLDEGIIKGVLLHREIDDFTDKHEIVRRSKKLLQAKYRHYSPVIMDVFYDHFLAANWSNYSTVPLLPYTEAFYSLAEKHRDNLPERAANMLKYMSAGNWLYNYQFVDGIDQALTGMSRRTTFVSKMEHAAKDLALHYDLFQADFELFFPDLIRRSEEFLARYEL